MKRAPTRTCSICSKPLELQKLDTVKVNFNEIGSGERVVEFDMCLVCRIALTRAVLNGALNDFLNGKD